MDQTDTAVRHRLQKEGKTAFETLFRSYHHHTNSVARAYEKDRSQANYTRPQICLHVMGTHVHNRFYIIR